MSKEVFMIGIGGMGMLPLACYLVDRGFGVCGWDDNLCEPSKGILEGIGAKLQKAIPENVSLIVYSSAIDVSHPILQAAKRQKIRCVRRGLFLAELLKDKKLLAVVGSHGKTTTTGLIISAFKRLKVDFSYLCGAVFRDKNLLPGHFSEKSEWVIAEIDESDGTIDAFSPERTLLVNLDWDHVTHYPTEALLKEKFQKLFGRTRGRVIVPESQRDLWDGENKEIWGKGYRFRKGSYLSTLFSDGLNFDVPFSGQFNIENTLAAIEAIKGIASLREDMFLDYQGICRRQECLLDTHRVRIYQDYAHHPREIESFLEAMSTSDRQTIVVFQPHRYSRTQQFAKKFAEVFRDVEHLYLLPVYAASESPEWGMDSSAIYEAFTDKSRITFFNSKEQFSLKTSKESTDILFIGAGDIEWIARNYAREYQSFLEKTLREGLRGELETNVPIKTTLGIGGSASFLIKPADLRDLRQVLKNAKEAGVSVFPLGRGSNLLIPDEGFSGLVISLNVDWLKKIELQDTIFTVGAGVRLKDFSNFAASEKIEGYNFLEGIPGTLGGALVMNAGAMGDSIGKRVVSIEVLDLLGNHRVLRADELNFEYRQCKSLQNVIILQAYLDASQTTSEDLRSEQRKFYQRRKQTQPLGASAGSTFKNPEGDFAGRLIEAYGFKGVKVGGAEVSQKHANFILNKGTASSRDFVSLVKAMKSSILEAEHINLEPEVQILGLNWNDILKTDAK